MFHSMARRPIYERNIFKIGCYRPANVRTTQVDECQCHRYTRYTRAARISVSDKRARTKYHLGCSICYLQFYRKCQLFLVVDREHDLPGVRGGWVACYTNDILAHTHG